MIYIERDEKKNHHCDFNKGPLQKTQQKKRKSFVYITVIKLSSTAKQTTQSGLLRKQ